MAIWIIAKRTLIYAGCLTAAPLSPPLKLYHKPLNSLPFDDYEETEAGPVIKALRDAAYFGTYHNFTVTWLQRRALISRLENAGKPVPAAIMSAVNQAGISRAGRVSLACKIAVISLYEKTHGNISVNYTQAANVLSACVAEAGYSHRFSKDTLRNWYEEVKNTVQKIPHR